MGSILPCARRRHSGGLPAHFDGVQLQLPDVPFAGGKAGALAVHSATRTLAIVLITPEHPVASGLANTTSPTELLHRCRVSLRRRPRQRILKLGIGHPSNSS
jgi:hypothetical protein